MLGFDRAIADPELLDVVAESERHAEDGDVTSLGALVSSWLGLSGGEPAVLQLDDPAPKETAAQHRRHDLSDITELEEIPEQPEETIEEGNVKLEISETVPGAETSPTAAGDVKPATPSRSEAATSPTFRERLANLFSRLQSPSPISASVIDLPPSERPGTVERSETDRRASAASRLSLDETDGAIPPPSYTLGRPDPILLNPGLLPLIESPKLNQSPTSPPERLLERRRRSGVTAPPPDPAQLELRQLPPVHSQYGVHRGRAVTGWRARAKVDDVGRF